MKAAPLISSLNAGELGPTLDGRTDLPKYTQGAKVSENFLHLIQGPARRRGGSKFIEAVKNSAHRSWDVKFEFSATQAFVLEFGDGYVRFFTSRAQLLVSGVAAYNAITNYVVGDLVSSVGVNYYCIAATVGNAPPNATYWYPLTGSVYEIPSPYAIADLTMDDGTCALDLEQSGDVLYIANRKRTHEPQTLTRYGNTNWQFAEYAPNQGPFGALNSTSTTLYASASTGPVTLTASTGIFAATDIGRLVRLEVQNQDEEPWETAKSYTANDLVRSDGKTYKALNTDTSGTATPIHDHGTAFDGQGGVQWEYQDAGYGIARITAFTSSTQVTATVIDEELNGLKQIPAGAVGVANASRRWQLGAWSDTTGWPSTVTFFKNRLWWGTKQGLHGTVPNDFTNMSEDFFNELRDDCAINHTLQAQDVNEILWIEGADKLVIGTGGGEFVGGEITTNAPLSPSNFQTLRQSKRRVRGVDPVAVGTSLFYVQRAGRKLLALNYDIQVDRFRSADQNVLNDRITRSGIIAICYQGEPDSIIWAVLANGRLVGFTTDDEQNVAGWGRQRLGGDAIVESCLSIPSPDGLREDLWLTVRRTINGATVRYHEYMEKAWEGPDEDGTDGDAQEDAFYVDSGLTYDGVPADMISGLDHLEGETVQVLGDGAVMAEQVVTGGAITLPREVSKAQIGLQFISRLVPMRIEVPTQDGTSVGKLKRANAATVRFVDTLGGKAGTYRGKMDSLSFRRPSVPMGEAPPFESRDADVTFGGNYSSDGLLEIRQEQPLPMTIVAIAPRMHVNGP